MTARRVLLALGSLWDLVRFYLVISLLTLIVRSAGGEGSAMVPWLLLAGTGNLLVPVGGLMLALFPQRYGSLLGLLRLGKGLSVFSFVLLLVSGSIRSAVNASVVHVGGRALSGVALVLGLFVLDAAFLALLMIPAAGARLPLAGLAEAEMKDFH